MKAGIESKFIADSVSATGDFKKYVRKQFRDRRDFLIGLLDSNMIVSSADANTYVDKIVNEIISGNPFLKAVHPRTMLYRAWWPNAFSAGEGTIMINLGLFNKLTNESQLAFILCHELAHLYLDHSNRAINDYVNTVYADEFQKELKSIKKSSYLQNKKLDELEKSITFTSRRHGRLHETEADSMAVLLMSKTNFDVRESLTALDLLDKIDSSFYNMDVLLKKTFHYAEYPFKESWIQKERSFFGEVKEDNLPIYDSLKTHPDCKKRIAVLTPLVKEFRSNGQLFPISKKSFSDQQDSLKLEVIETLIAKNEISRALHHTLVLQHEKNEAPVLAVFTARCLNKIYSNQKQHTLGKITDRPSPYHAKDYNTLVKFIEPLRLEEIASLAYYYTNHNAEAGKGNKDFEKERQLSTLHFNQNPINK